MNKVRKVVFVCQANIARSQMAEAFYNHFTHSSAASSGAVKDYRAKYNYKPTPNIVNLMSEVGIDISAQRVKVVTEQMVADADLVVVLCEKELCFNFLLKDKKVIHREIEDPFQQDIDTMRRIRDEVAELVKEIITSCN